MSEEAMLTQQIDDLRERMKLLQGDRRANMEIIQANKDANKDEISRLRSDNKELHLKVASIQKSSGAGGEATDDDVASLHVEALKARKTYDALHLQCNANKKELQEQKDEVRQLELEARRPNQEDSPLTRNIRMLENRLDKAMIKYNEAQSIRKTYEQIVKRLREERIGFDSQLGALERTMQAKTRDYEELLLLSGDATHARDVAKGELDRVRSSYEEEKRRRDSTLRDRHQELALRRQTQDLLKARAEKAANIRAQEEAKANGYGISGEGAESLRAAASVNSMTATRIAEERKEHQMKIDLFESAFRTIKEATGVSDVNQVIQKIVTQEGTTENLVLLTKDNQAKIRALTHAKEAARQRVDEVKYAGGGGGHRRKLVDDLEEQCHTAVAKLDRSRAKVERLNGVLISVKAGVKHLQEKVAPAMQDLGVGGHSSGELTDESVASALEDTEKALVRLLQRVKASKAEEAALMGGSPKKGGKGNKKKKAKKGESKLDSSSDDDDDDAEDLLRVSQAALSGDVDDAVLAARPHNQRIELPVPEDGWFGEGLPADFGANGNGNGGGGDDGGGEEGGELTRAKVKQHASTVVRQKAKEEEARKKAEADALLGIY